MTKLLNLFGEMGLKSVLMCAKMFVQFSLHGLFRLHIAKRLAPAVYEMRDERVTVSINQNTKKRINVHKLFHSAVPKHSNMFTFYYTYTLHMQFMHFMGKQTAMAMSNTHMHSNETICNFHFIKKYY